MTVDTQTLVLMILLPILPVVVGVGGSFVVRRLSEAEYRKTQVAVSAEEAKDL
jgi:hypothetical protein